MKHLPGLLAALLLGALTLTGAPLAAAAPPTLDRGPVTVFDVVIAGGLPALQIRDETGTVAPVSTQRDPADVVLRDDGTGALELSWSTERLPDRGPDAVVGLQIWAGGPGHVQLGAAGADGLYQIWDSAGDTEQPLVLEPGSADALAWSFTEAGRYEITVLPSWYTADGAIRGESVTYTIDVATAAPEPVDPRSSAPVTSSADPVEPCFGTPVENPDAEIVDDGHFDFGVQVDGGELTSRVKDDRSSPAVWRDPSALLFRLDEPARKQVPDYASNPNLEPFSFLGDPGDDVWMVGQGQESGVPWLGWNTQHASARENIDGPTTWTLDGVDGPGDLFVYQNEMGGVTELFGTPGDWPDELVIPANVHVHGNWAFTEPGVYHVHTTHSATLSSGDQARSSGTLTFLVGDCEQPADKPEAPLDADRLLADHELIEDNRGGVTVDPHRVAVGDRVSLTVPLAEDATWVTPVVYSEPQQTPWVFVRDGGELSSPVTIPQLAEGRHKIAVYTATGDLAGWAPFTVVSDDGSDGGSGGGSGGNDGGSGGGSGGDTDGSGSRTDGPDAGGGSPNAPDAGTNGAPVRIPVGGAPGAVRGPAVDPCPDDAGATGTDGADDATGPGATGGGPDGPAESVADGHFDFGAIIEGGQLVPRVKDDRPNPPAWVHPESFVFALGAAAEMEVPDNASYAFLGSPGDTVWLIPETQKSGIPWLGWNTQHETVRSEVDGSVGFTLDGVDGPGDLLIYLGDSFGGVGERFLGSAAGFPTTAQVPLNVHRHGNWAFTEPGSYRVTITQSATLNSGEQVSASGTLVFQVGGGSTAPSSVESQRSGGFSFASGVRTDHLDGHDADGEDGPGLSAQLRDADGDGAGDGDSGDGDGSSGTGDVTDGDAAEAKDDCLPSTGASGDSVPLLLFSVLLLCAGVAVVAASTRRTFRPLA